MVSLLRVATSAISFPAVCFLVACPEEQTESACEALSPEQIAAEVASSEVPLNDPDPVLIEALAVVFSCDEIPDNRQGVGAECDTHADCGHERAICVKGILPCATGR
jgi:hypothetical protein